MSARRDSVALTTASIANGLAAYAIVVVASRLLGDRDFASFSVAWSIWAVSVALLVFPVQHWIIWRSAVDGDKSGIRSALPRILAISALVVLGLFFSGTLERLFPVGQSWPWILAVIGATSATLGFGRGLLGADGRYSAVAWVIGLENTIRLAVIAVALSIGFGPEAAVLGVATGVLALAPFARETHLGEARSEVPVKVVSELAALAGATAVAQVLVQFPAAMAEWLGEPADRVAALFATFSLGRAPLLMALALTTLITDPLTRLVGHAERAIHMLRRALLMAASGAAMIGVVGYVIGPAVVTWLFGEGRALSPAETGLIGAGIVLAMAGLVSILGLMALRAHGSAMGYWAAALAVFLIMSSLGSGIPIAFLAGEMLALVLSSATLFQRLRREALAPDR